MYSIYSISYFISKRPCRVINEPKYGNKCLFFEFGPEDSERTIDMRFYIKRKEKAAYTPDYIDREKYLEAQRLTPIDDNFKAIAGEVVAGKKSDLVRARALYDHVIDRMRYMKYGSGWGKGDVRL